MCTGSACSKHAKEEGVMLAARMQRKRVFTSVCELARLLETERGGVGR